jgi:predicted ATP-grasp superfamily ATP-dependent carboligase
VSEQSGQRLNVLLLDGESIHSLNVAASLSREPGLRLYAMSARKWPLSRTSLKIRAVIFCPARDDRAMIDVLRKVVDQYKIQIVVGCDTPGITFLSRNSAAIRSFVFHASVPAPEQLTMANDKWRTAVELERHQIPLPRTMLLGPAAAEIGFPMLIKRRSGEGGYGIVKINEQRELDSALARIGKRREDYIVQSFIAGSNIDCSVLCRNGKILASTVQRPIRENYAAFTPCVENTIELIPDVLAVVEKLMGMLKWNGVANVDLRRAENGKIMVLEINARYWATLLASVVSGVNFPYLAVLDAQGKNFAVPEYAKRDCYGFDRWIKRRKEWMILSIPPLIRIKLFDPFPWILMRLIRVVLGLHQTRRAEMSGVEHRS